MEGRPQSFFASMREKCAIQDSGHINNLCYSANGEYLVYTAGDALKVYTAANAALKNIITVSVGCMAFAQSHTILHTQSDSDAIFYLSIHDNKHLRRFCGHAGAVESISADPLADVFMSTGPAEANLWDMRADGPAKKIRTRNSTGALSRDGHYALCDNNFVRVFDARQDSGPVHTAACVPGLYRRLWYTADSARIVLASHNGYTFLSADGRVQGLIGLENECDGDTSPDSDILLCCTSKHVFAYSIADRQRLGAYGTVGAPNVSIRANPAAPQLACASMDRITLYSL
ncbi:COMPASS component SWD2 [Pancytospora philotis]|nr:COMPASS component SWD2 [Pancytospora philotis]